MGNAFFSSQKPEKGVYFCQSLQGGIEVLNGVNLALRDERDS
jgi:hypothetical protein